MCVGGGPGRSKVMVKEEKETGQKKKKLLWFSWAVLDRHFDTPQFVSIFCTSLLLHLLHLFFFSFLSFSFPKNAHNLLLYPPQGGRKMGHFFFIFFLFFETEKERS